MIVSALTSLGDWTFGNGIQNYKSANAAIAQSIQTRLLMFLNDCFFAMEQGIDWYTLLGGKNQIAMQLAVNATILGTDGVLSLNSSSVVYTASTRNIALAYSVNTVYTGVTSNYPLAGGTNYLVTEGGDFITDQSGNRLII